MAGCRAKNKQTNICFCGFNECVPLISEFLYSSAHFYTASRPGRRQPPQYVNLFLSRARCWSASPAPSLVAPLHSATLALLMYVCIHALLMIGTWPSCRIGRVTARHVHSFRHWVVREYREAGPLTCAFVCSGYIVWGTIQHSTAPAERPVRKTSVACSPVYFRGKLMCNNVTEKICTFDETRRFITLCTRARYSALL